MSIQRYRAQQAKPMTCGDTVKFMRTYIKNMSAAYYSSGPSLGYTPAAEVPADTGVSTDKTVPADQRVPADKGVLADTSIPAITGVSADANVPADQRVPADQGVPADASIPADTCVSAEAATTTIPVNAPLDEDEPAEELSSLRRSTRKKSVAKKRTTHPSSSIPFSTDDPDAAHRVFPSGLGTIHTLLCHGGIRKTFTTLREILHMVDRQTLIRLYGFVDALSKKQPLDGLALSL
nr:hypothetical protein [Tanacetum cinerariifolium]